MYYLYCVHAYYQGVAIGGDRYPGTRFIDHLQRYNDDPNVKMLVLLGEVLLQFILLLAKTACYASSSTYAHPSSSLHC
jgi:hypothetical protein